MSPRMRASASGTGVSTASPEVSANSRAVSISRSAAIISPASSRTRASRRVNPFGRPGPEGTGRRLMICAKPAWKDSTNGGWRFPGGSREAPGPGLSIGLLRRRLRLSLRREGLAPLQEVVRVDRLAGGLVDAVVEMRGGDGGVPRVPHGADDLAGLDPVADL